MKKAYALEFLDPKRLLDRAASEGYVGAVFKDRKEAVLFAKRVRRTLLHGAEHVAAARQERKLPKAADYIGADAWESLYVHLDGLTVKIVNVQSPKGAAHLPQFKIEGP